MSLNIETRFFLGANSPNGFYSLYSQFADIRSGDVMYIMKGGPGCGKSSFIKTIAAAASAVGYGIEYIQCSGDPDSLDGIRIPLLGVAFIDGTAPHVAEPLLPGAAESYIDLGSFYDSDALRPFAKQLLTMGDECRALYQRAYSLISAAYSATNGLYDSLVTDDVRRVIAKRTRGILSRELKPSGKSLPGKITPRFLTALTCKGTICLWDTVTHLASRVYTLDNEFGLSHYMLTEIADAAAGRGYDVILCPSPLCPEKAEHCLIPELSLAFVSITGDSPYPGSAYRHIRLDALPDNARISKLKKHAAVCSRCSSALYGEAVRVLGRIKSIHDEIESVYNPHVDFDGIYALAVTYSLKLLDK